MKVCIHQTDSKKKEKGIKTKAASRMFPGEIWCVISVKCAFGLKAVMTPFMAATNQSVVPKSVVKVIMLVSGLNSDIDICG